MTKLSRFTQGKCRLLIIVLLLFVLFSPLLAPNVYATPDDNSDDVYVALSDGSRFVGTARQWHDNFCSGKNICEVGDVNGDGKADVVAFVRTSHGPDDSDVYVALSDGTKFGVPQKWHDYFCTIDEICKLGDVNGDGKTDLIVFVRTSGRGNDDDVWVAFSDGTKFGQGQKWHDYFCTLAEICDVGDFNGDGKTDIVTFVRTSNRGNDDDVYVAFSDGTKFGPGQKWHDYFCTLDELCAVGDVNGDGKDDIITFVRTSNRGNDDDVYVALSDGATFGQAQKWHDYFCTLEEICDVGDVNGDGKADLITFVRTSGRGNDDDVYVALSNGAAFVGQGLKWHDYFCTLQEVCAVGDVNGDGKADAVVFTRTRSDFANNTKTIDLTISLYNAPADRTPYIGILEHFADAIYEMSNGTQRIGKVTIFQNGENRETADVVWQNNVWPNVPGGCISGRGRSGCRIYMGDTFPFKTPYPALQSTKWRGAGYTLGHEWGHFYYGLYDEYDGTATCTDKPTDIYALQTCDSMPDSVMDNQWNAADGDLNWLNFGIAVNQTKKNVTWRVYDASDWEVLARSPNQDPRDGQRKDAAKRTYYAELAAVAPTGNAASPIELPTSNARGALQIIWITPTTMAQAATAVAGNYMPTIRLVNGTSVLYPEAAVLVAMVEKDGGFVAKAEINATVTAPDGSTTSLPFHDAGIAPDAAANDGLYTASWLYNQNGQHMIAVAFNNNAGMAEVTHVGNHYTPDPEGDEYAPTSTPIAEAFQVQANVTMAVNGYPPETGSPPLPTQLTTDNLDFPGRIDNAGDKDTFTFTAEQTGELVVRLTDFDLGMRPAIKLFKGVTTPTLIDDYQFTPSDNRYFFTKLAVEAGDLFVVEVTHSDPNAVTGLFTISVGPALPNPTEQTQQPEQPEQPEQPVQTQSIYLPLVTK